MVTQQKATQIIILRLLLLDIYTQHVTMTSNTVITPTKGHDTTMYIVVFPSRNEEAVRKKYMYVIVVEISTITQHVFS